MASPQSKRSPAFQFYPKEFLSSSKVIAMTATERGVYITLLATQWLDGSLPADMTTLAKLAGVNVKQLTRLWPHNLGRCFTTKGGRLVNPRLEMERKKQAEYRERQAFHGAKGGRPSGKGLPSEPFPKTKGSERFASPSPISDLQSAKTDVRPAPIVARRRLDAAWEGAKGLYVPQRKHSDFIALRNHPGAEVELCAWYEAVAEAWEGSPGADMMKFWTARYDEKWPTVATAPDRRKPSWATR